MRIEIPPQGAVVGHYGVTHQTMILMEECAELAKAASKLVRLGEYGEGEAGRERRRADLAEEIGDVLICIAQMMCAYGVSEEDVEKGIREKCRKVSERIGYETAASRIGKDGKEA